MAKDDFNNNELENYYSKIYSSLENNTLEDPFGKYVLARIKGGQKTVLNKTQSEIRNFDMSFLDIIESVYPAILKIMRNPKKSLRYETEVVAVEKAKKVNADTVRHLSSHTHLIKEIKQNGDVIPSKVQTTYAEEELAIYENRFIKSLVKRTEIFLERRYEVMKVSLESFETERLKVKNEFKMSGQQVTVDLDIQIKNDLTTNVETTKEQYNRLLYIREMIQGLKGTEFMRALAKARDVLPPIMKTNVILHNPDFKLCYGLWLYLDRVDSIATNIDVKEKTYKYPQVFDNDVNEVMTIALTTFIKNRGIEGIYSSKKLPQIKAPKPQVDTTVGDLELNLDADNKKLEDYTMNELLLSKTAEYFGDSFKGISQTGATFNESIRVVYRQMLDMLDQIYPAVFGISDDELESKDLYEQLEYARRQMMINKIVRQQKQMNLAHMGREDKRIEKVIAKLEEKIKRQEAREREKQERERQKAEAERLAQIEKQKAIEAKKRKLEQDAIKKAQELEIKRQEMLKAENQKSAKRREEMARIYDAHAKKRDHLKEVQAEENKNFKEMTPQDYAQAEPTAIPRIKRDEFDEMTDEELRQLLEENELLDSIPEMKPEEDEPKREEKPVPTIQAKKKEPKPSPKKSKNTDDIDLDNLSDDDLDQLLASNGILGDDVNFTAADLAPTKEDNEEEVDDLPDDIGDISDEELDALLDENGIDNINAALDDKPVEKKKPTISKNKKKPEPEVASRPEPTLEEPVEENISEEAPKEDEVSEPTDNKDELGDVSDEELDQLLNENGIEDNQEPEENNESSEEPEEVVEPETTDDNSLDEPEPDLEALDEDSNDEIDDILNEVPEAQEETPMVDENLNQEEEDDLDALLNEIPEAEEDEEPSKESSSDDDLDDISDEDLEALLKENGMI